MKDESYMNYFKKANENFRSKNYEEAIKLYKKAFSLENENRVLYNIGVCYYFLNNLDKASKYYKKAIEQELKRKDSNKNLLNKIYYNLAIISSDNNNLKKAYHYFKIALCYNPYDIETNKEIKIIEDLIIANFKYKQEGE